MIRYLKIQIGMLQIKRTKASDSDFRFLVSLLDAELAEIDGEEHAFYDQFNSIDQLNYCLVAYADGKPVACGALKSYDDDHMEIKRMFTLKTARGQGFATDVVQSLESWAKELGKRYCLLETGKRQKDAVALYQKNGYVIVPNYGQYQGIENSVCFKKLI